MLLKLTFTSLLGLLAFGHSATLPYNPSTALLSSNSTAVYLFQPNEDATTYQLSVINLTSTISTTKIGNSIIASSLPFVPQSTTALIASIDISDKISLVSGECQDGAGAAQLYTLNPTDVEAAWTKMSVDAGGVENPSANGGVNMLSRSMQFNDQLYIFGGMCPNSSSLTVENWQASASYSNSLLSMSSQGTISQLATRGPPVPEAGFSVTPLEPAYLNSSHTTVSQQNFVLIGGQTQSAFINISYLALFSLPEESWSFTSVDSSSISATITPRSGHAAAISSDGKKIFVSGGWVGDVNTPADPPFITLNIGSTYGGSGTWSWSIPDQSGTPPNVYGHSMISLPGDILMISGGYALPSSASRIRRREGPNMNTYFYNTSSNSWVTEYTNPNIAPSTNTGSSLSNSTRIGLGVGLGLGLGLLLIIGLCLWFGRRKIREHRRERDRRLLQQSMNAANGPQPYREEQAQWMTERNRTGADPYPWAPAQGDIDSVRRASQAEQTALAYDIPSPTRGLRRSLHSRPPSLRYDDRVGSRASGRIHTIAESDENEKVQDQSEKDILANAPVLDPFQDPTHILDRRSPSPTSPAHERELEMQHWYNDWAEAERQQNSGRNSPNKSDRTSSTLSDSNRSIVSALSYQPSLRRDGSKKSTPQVSPPDTPIAATQRRNRSKSFGITNRLTESFPKLQAEGQALLGGPTPAVAVEPSSSQRSSASKGGLLGSFKRALANKRNSTSGPERSATTAGNMPHNPGSYSPQRSASLGTTTYSQRRQGAQDWGENPSPPKSVNEDAVGDDDWDVESAVERRVVQVMFTVPRGSLRVVNAGPDGDAASMAEVEGGAGVEEVDRAKDETALISKRDNNNEEVVGKGKAREENDE